MNSSRAGWCVMLQTKLACRKRIDDEQNAKSRSQSIDSQQGGSKRELHAGDTPPRENDSLVFLLLCLRGSF